MTDQEILDGAFNLIKVHEGFRNQPYWDVDNWRNGYATIAENRFEWIDEKEAEKRSREHTKKDYEYMKKVLPDLANDPIAIPLLSLAYQYGSGKLKEFKGMDLDQVLEKFYGFQDFKSRRVAEIAYYLRMVELNPRQDKLAFTGKEKFALGLLVVIVGIIVWWKFT